MGDIRIAFIGCGGNGRGHITRFNEMADVDLVGVCDVDGNAAQAVAAEAGTAAFADFRKMLDETRPDALGVSIPVFAHGDIEREVAARRMPLFVEKPVAGNMAEAREYEGLLRDAGVITCVGYQLRYTASATAARRLLAAQTPRLAVGRYWCGTLRQGRWHHSKAAGGQLVEQATHTLDMMRFLLGDIEEVFALETHLTFPDAEVPDAHAVAVKFASGAAGTLSATWAADLEMRGEGNIIDIFYDRYHMNWQPYDVTIAPEPEGDAALPEAENGLIERAFVEAVKIGDPSKILSDYSEGVRTLAVSLAANASAQLGQPVRPDSL